jgi:putative pyruvate formate lyase activating enzyme
MIEILKNCTLCPRKCQANRLAGQKGFCGADNTLKVGRASLHMWEEPCISGTNGSGTVFFSNCTLKCVFCQNSKLSQENAGITITTQKLADIFLDLQNKGANNINLVTPTHYVPQIIEALTIAKNNGLTIPTVYNSSGYENLETIKALAGFIDIYLPDLKYFDSKYSVKYSNAKDYFEIAMAAIEEMVKQVGNPDFFDNGMMKKGVIIRHLMLPGLLFDSKKIIDAVYNKFKDSVYISIMNQYTPFNQSSKYPELNKTLNPKHYDSLVDYAVSIGVKNGFIQDSGTASESFIPSFNGEGII